MDIRRKIEVYRLGALCGIYTKNEVVELLDKLICELDDVPSEVIEASLLASKNINDISDKLKELTWEIKYEKYFGVKDLLHVIGEKYYAKEISLEDSIYYLYNMLKNIDIPEEIIPTIHYLSDGLYLAEQDICGDIEEIRKGFLEFINEY